jgi:hypothetical protein
MKNKTGEQIFVFFVRKSQILKFMGSFRYHNPQIS